jgi:hypothetical protein
MLVALVVAGVDLGEQEQMLEAAASGVVVEEKTKQVGATAALVQTAVQLDSTLNASAEEACLAVVADALVCHQARPAVPVVEEGLATARQAQAALAAAVRQATKHSQLTAVVQSSSKWPAMTDMERMRLCLHCSMVGIGRAP